MFESALIVLKAISFALLFMNMTPEPAPVPQAPVVIQAPVEEAPYTDSDVLKFVYAPRPPMGEMIPQHRER